MSTSNAEIEQQCASLRLELKAWERQFSADNEGRKPSNKDIKADAQIAAKYKEYSKLRDVLSGKATAPSSPKSSRKRKVAEHQAHTPSKRRTPPAATPTRPVSKNEELPKDEPIPAPQLFTPAHVRSVIGPTPQKDGMVLGLFDLLPSETPSKVQRQIFGDIPPNVLATPSKRSNKSEDDLTLTGRAKRSRTPQSEGKRYLLDQFATPMKRKREEEGTPSALRHLSTPMFLRRESRIPDMIPEEDESPPRAVPWKQKGLVRSLSSMIQGLKKQEEDRLDEELDILREMEEMEEMEASGFAAPPRKKPAAPEVLVEDSQVVMPLGPDGLVESDGEEPEGDQGALGRDGQPRKVWKKRGQKRTTKRVIMRPVQRKAPAPAAIEEADDDEEDEGGDGVPETQADLAGLSEPGSEDDEEGSDYSDASHASKERKTRPKQAEETKSLQAKPAEEEGVVKKAARKISATAHANFRRLKLRNKNSKGTGGRFGRGRR